MSINAIVSGVYWGENGEHRIELSGEERGQPQLNFREPAPPDVNLLAGQQIWGSANTIMLGETKIAERESYTAIRFVVPWIGKVINRERERKEKRDTVPGPPNPPRPERQREWA